MLGLILSDAGLSAHAATHAGDTGNCELCGSWGTLTPVSPVPADHSVAVPKCLSVAPTVTALLADVHSVVFRQRGPPVSD
ncbi:MAG: hypothetical protein KJP08_02375 [Gammaproteobacteria bacterium]|nr:hypothetical protein [Gammaproteobacteria bacterium]MBT8093631.1 hypothetical protein [Gammaproteobacteria bacterium]NNF48517.1 hypothetical protein [Woeseiaceae bacterium]NNL63080.1 hypothetical protein [Woeseiaceae bacterium]